MNSILAGEEILNNTICKIIYKDDTPYVVNLDRNNIKRDLFGLPKLILVSNVIPMNGNGDIIKCNEYCRCIPIFISTNVEVSGIL